jgi:hypothetical protein
MQCILLKSKIHGATLTVKKLRYEGSIALDRDLIAAADLWPGEQVHVPWSDSPPAMVQRIAYRSFPASGEDNRQCRQG